MPVVVRLWYKRTSKMKNPLKIKGFMCGAGGIRIIKGCYAVLCCVEKVRKINGLAVMLLCSVMPLYVPVVVRLWYGKKSVVCSKINALKPFEEC